MLFATLVHLLTIIEERDIIMLRPFLVAALVMLTGGYTIADDRGASSVAGLDLTRANALQMQLCSLKPGKKMKDYEANFNAYIEWSKTHFP